MLIDPKIYTAGKTWAAHWFRPLKDQFNINARWIDIQSVLADENDAIPNESHADEEYKRRIWDKGCKVDCMTCDMMIMACHPDDGNMHSGSLVELGHVTSNNRPVYILGTCESVEPVGNSDRAWRSQACVHWFPEVDVKDPLALEMAFLHCVGHYRDNYAAQYIGRRIAERKIA